MPVDALAEGVVERIHFVARGMVPPVGDVMSHKGQRGAADFPNRDVAQFLLAGTRLFNVLAGPVNGLVPADALESGEIAALSRIADPDCGLITNVGKAHLEGFGSFEGVVRTKGELYDYLRRKGGYVFLDADNPHLAAIAGGLAAFRYGAPGRGYDVEGELAGDGPMLSLRWRPAGGEWQTVGTHLVGAYNLSNALAAAAVGTRFGVAPEAVSQALADYVPTNNRSELLDTGRNRLIVDAYNANPTSMAAALDNFGRIRSGAVLRSRRAAVYLQRIQVSLPDCGQNSPGRRENVF